jgi:hypothetical protein
MRCVLLNRFLSVWCCVYLWYPRFLMRCVLLNRLLSVWYCAYPWYPDIRGKHNTTQKVNGWATRTSLRTGDIRGKHNTTQKGNDVLCLPLISPVLNEVRVTQPFPFCVVLCFPLISPVLNEVRFAQSFAFCVVLSLSLISPALNEVRVAQSFPHHTESKRLSNTHLIKNRGYQG